MLHNEILESGQYVSLFNDILLAKDFQRLVLLVKPVSTVFIHHYGSLDYRLQEWSCDEVQPYHSKYFFCIGQVEPTIVYTPHITYTTNTTNVPFTWDIRA